MTRAIASVMMILLSAYYTYADNNILRDTIEITPKAGFRYNLLNLNTFRLHPVNGVDIQETCALILRPNESTTLDIATRVEYAFLPKIFEPELSFELRRNEKHIWNMKAGRELHDWKLEEYTEMKWIKNSFSYLFAHKNYKKLIDKQYFTASYTIKPNEKSYIKATFDRYDLATLENNSTFSIRHCGQPYKPNVPENNFIDSILVLSPRTGVTALTIESELALGKRDYSPVLDLKVRYVNHVRVVHPQIAISQTISHSRFEMVHWRVNYGFFAGGETDKLSFHEWQHFQDSRKFFPVRDRKAAIVGFVAQDAYALSTNDWHIDTSFRLFKEKMILLQIPVLRSLEMGESIVLSNIYTKQRGKLYTEVGYELLNVGKLFHIGVFTSFDGKEYKETNIRMGISTFNWENKKIY